MNKVKKTHNPDRTPTRYGFLCGYIANENVTDMTSVSLDLAGFDTNLWNVKVSFGDGESYWKQYEGSMGEAKRRWKKTITLVRRRVNKKVDGAKFLDLLEKIFMD